MEKEWRRGGKEEWVNGELRSERDREKERKRRRQRGRQRGREEGSEGCAHSLITFALTGFLNHNLSKNKHNGHTPEMDKNSAAVAILRHQLRANINIFLLVLDQHNALDCTLLEPPRFRALNVHPKKGSLGKRLVLGCKSRLDVGGPGGAKLWEARPELDYV